MPGLTCADLTEASRLADAISQSDPVASVILRRVIAKRLPCDILVCAEQPRDRSAAMAVVLPSPGRADSRPTTFVVATDVTSAGALIRALTARGTPVTFGALREDFQPALRACPGSVRQGDLCFNWLCPQEWKAPATAELPIGMSFRQLLPSDADLVDSHWQHSRPGVTRDYVAALIAGEGGGCGGIGVVKTNVDGQEGLVSWVLEYEYGSLGLLHTLDECRRGGIARLVLTKMFRRVREGGAAHVWLSTVQANTPAVNLMAALGLERAPHAVSWTFFSPPK